MFFCRSQWKQQKTMKYWLETSRFPKKTSRCTQTHVHQHMYAKLHRAPTRMVCISFSKKLKCSNKVWLLYASYMLDPCCLLLEATKKQISVQKLIIILPHCPRPPLTPQTINPTSPTTNHQNLLIYNIMCTHEKHKSKKILIPPHKFLQIQLLCH